jgi:hypothetical protein
MIFELIGLRFAPRIRDPPPRPLHCTDPRCRRNPRSCSSKSPGRADHAMPRRAAARRGLLRYGCAPARMLMPVRRPSASRNLLAPAPQEYGRLVKMNFIITGWLGDKQPPSESAASSIAALTRASGSTTTRARSPGLRACEGVNQRQPIPGIRRAAWPQALDPSVQSCAAAYGLRTRDQGPRPLRPINRHRQGRPGSRLAQLRVGTGGFRASVRSAGSRSTSDSAIVPMAHAT